MTRESFNEKFTISSRSATLWQHPYFKLVKLHPTLALLQDWAIQAGMIDELFAEILTNLLNNDRIDSSAHPALQQNLSDELGNGNPQKEHFQLFKNVLHVLDVSIERYRATAPLPGTQSILDGLRNATNGSDPVRALAVMASEEAICPQEFPLLVSAINELMPPSTQWKEYFDVHCEADIRHSTELTEHLYTATHGDPNLISHALACQGEDQNWNYLFYDSLLLQT
jgi:pyrroloquinoline quinone (PQQ) biosynthesis protein C